MFAYSVPWPVATALDSLRGTRLDIGAGWTASANPEGPGALLSRAGFIPGRTPPRKTAEGWTYHGHSASLSAFRRAKVPESTEYITIRGESILAPLAQLAPQSIDFSTGQAGDFADDWAREAFRLHDSREMFSDGGRDFWRLTGTDADLARVILLCIQATHAVTAEALSDCRSLTTADRAGFVQTVWGYSLGKINPAGGGG